MNAINQELEGKILDKKVYPGMYIWYLSCIQNFYLNFIKSFKNEQINGQWEKMCIVFSLTLLIPHTPMMNPFHLFLMIQFAKFNFGR